MCRAFLFLMLGIFLSGQMGFRFKTVTFIGCNQTVTTKMNLFQDDLK